MTLGVRCLGACLREGRTRRSRPQEQRNTRVRHYEMLNRGVVRRVTRPTTRSRCARVGVRSGWRERVCDGGQLLIEESRQFPQVGEQAPIPRVVLGPCTDIVQDSAKLPSQIVDFPGLFVTEHAGGTANCSAACGIECRPARRHQSSLRYGERRAPAGGFPRLHGHAEVETHGTRVGAPWRGSREASRGE